MLSAKLIGRQMAARAAALKDADTLSIQDFVSKQTDHSPLNNSSIAICKDVDARAIWNIVVNVLGIIPKQTIAAGIHPASGCFTGGMYRGALLVALPRNVPEVAAFVIVRV